MQIQLSEHETNEMINALTSGLCYDGGHHKQYYLEKVLQILVGEREMLRMKSEEEWDDGIPA